MLVTVTSDGREYKVMYAIPVSTSNAVMISMHDKATSRILRRMFDGWTACEVSIEDFIPSVSFRGLAVSRKSGSFAGGSSRGAGCDTIV